MHVTMVFSFLKHQSLPLEYLDYDYESCSHENLKEGWLII